MTSIKLGKFSIRFAPALWVFAGLYLFFILTDLASSKQTGHAMAGRQWAHLSLVLLVSFLGTYLIGAFVVLKKGIPLSRILVHLVLITFWIILENTIYHNYSWYMMLSLNMSVLWICSYIFFYFQTATYPRPVFYGIWFFFFVYIVATFYYFFDASRILNRTPVLNIAYCVLAFLPWIYARGSARLRTLALLFSLIPVLLSMKRGAYIALFCMLFVDVLIRSITEQKLVKRVFAFCLVGMLLVGGITLVDKYSDGFLSQRFSYEQLADGSGRRGMYALAWKDITKRSIGTFVIGKGSGSSLTLLEAGVHNEWLEFLFTYGLIGLLLYAGLILSMLRKTYQQIKCRSKFAPATTMMCILYLVLSFISTGYGGYIGLLLFGFWGYLDALEKHKGILYEKNSFVDH